MAIICQIPILISIAEEVSLSEILQLRHVNRKFRNVINPQVLSVLISRLKTVDSHILIKYITKSEIDLAIVKGLLKNPCVDLSEKGIYPL